MKHFTLLAGLFFGVLFLSPTESDAQWVQMSNSMGNLLAANANTIFAADYYSVYKSTNNGTTWTLTPFYSEYEVTSLAANGNNVFAVGIFYWAEWLIATVYLSTNNGATWTPTSLSLWDGNVFSLVVNANNVFAGTGGGVYKSTDNGTSWTQTLLNNRDVLSLAVNGTNVFAGTSSYGVYKSTDNGTSWTQTSLNPVDLSEVNSLAVNGNYIFAGVSIAGEPFPYSTIYLSTNNGTDWTETPLQLGFQSVSSIARSGSNVFAGAGSGVYLSTDNGTSWSAVNTGLTSTDVRALAVSPNGAGGSDLFAGTYGGGVWRRPLSEMITSVQQTSDELPNGFALQQNYPNPFNPSTKIAFRVKSSESVELKVYDVLGRVVATLLNEELKPGSYEVTWDASGVASGVYFYRLQAGKYVDTKRLLLLR